MFDGPKLARRDQATDRASSAEEQVVTGPIRAAVVGCGAISKEHLSFIAADPSIELVGVCDLSQASREYAAERYGASAAYGSLEAMLTESRPAVVHVLTPPGTHPAVATACLEADANVVCEKPIAPTSAELEPMLEIANRRGLLLIESQNYRFNDHVLTIKQLIADGELGEILDAEVRITLDIASGGKLGDPNVPSPVAGLAGGAIHDFLPHMAYSVLQLVPDGQLDNVHALWRNLSGNVAVRFDDLDATCTVGDARLALRFSSFLEPEGFRIYARGTRGAAETDFFQPYLRVEVPRARGPLSPLANQLANGAGLVRSSATGLRDKLLQRSPYHGMPRMLDQFYRAVRGEAVCPIRPDDMRRPLALIDALVAEVAQR